MRILLVSAHFRPHVGGIERFTETLAEGLTGRGHEVTVLCCRTERGSAREESGSYRVVRVPSSSFAERALGVPYPVPAPLALLRAVSREVGAVDVVHVQDALYATSVAALLGARRTRVPSVLTQHVGFVPQGRRSLDAVQRLALASVGRSARLASRVVALNPDVAAFATRTWGLGAVAVAPVGVAAPGPVDRAAARRELGFAPNRVVAVFVGRDVAKKGLDLVLDAADPGYDLVAVTDRRIDGPPAHVRVLPFMEHGLLARLLAAADVFVLPSVGEGIPLALQEAMSHGLPVVATYDDGYRESFDRDDIVAVERTPTAVREALLRLASSPALRESFSARSRAVAAASFGVDRFLDAYERIYRDIASADRAS